MENDETCAFCDHRARTHCRHCGRPYCIEHGGAFCALCSDPVSGLPSAHLFQVAVWLLPVCAALGLWFLIGTPSLPGERSSGRVAAGASAPPRLAEPASTAQPPTATATPAATPAATDYTVKSGDTLQSIATETGATVPAIQQLNPSIDPQNLRIGQVLHIPAKSP